MDNQRFDREREFHDKWASAAELPDPRHVNEALTSPELRYIHRHLSPVKGKKVLDLGCGLGEASVYFAMCGADTTSIDLSPEMLRATDKLAEKNGVRVTTHLAAAEDLKLKKDQLFDIIYVGNLFHHVDVAATVKMLMPHLKPDGILASWDPVAYNPVINVYRRMAMDVRTVDEHPLKSKDIREITKSFAKADVKFFWLTTLALFLIMAFVQGRNPNKVRYWKAVVDESDKWAWLYRPLAAIDGLLLSLLPPLKWLCWNVVIIARHPKQASQNV